MGENERVVIMESIDDVLVRKWLRIDHRLPRIPIVVPNDQRVLGSYLADGGFTMFDKGTFAISGCMQAAVKKFSEGKAEK